VTNTVLRETVLVRRLAWRPESHRLLRPKPCPVDEQATARRAGKNGRRGGGGISVVRVSATRLVSGGGCGGCFDVRERRENAPGLRSVHKRYPDEFAVRKTALHPLVFPCHARPRRVLIPVGDSQAVAVIARPCVCRDPRTRDADRRGLLAKINDSESDINVWCSRRPFDKANERVYPAKRGPGIDAGLRLLEAVGSGQRSCR